MNYDQFLLFARISSFLVVLPLVIGLYYKIITRELYRPIFILQVVNLITELISSYLANKSINNIVVLNLFTFFEFFLVILFYKKFFDQFRKFNFHLILVILFLGLFIFTTFLAGNLKLIDNLSVSVESIILIAYSLSAFFMLMKSLMYENLLSTGFFWINVSILMYFSGNLFLFIFSRYLQKNDQSVYINLYTIHSILNTLYYIIISIGFWKARKV